MGLCHFGITAMYIGDERFGDTSSEEKRPGKHEWGMLCHGIPDSSLLGCICIAAALYLLLLENGALVPVKGHPGTSILNETSMKSQICRLEVNPVRWVATVGNTALAQNISAGYLEFSSTLPCKERSCARCLWILATMHYMHPLLPSAVPAKRWLNWQHPIPKSRIIQIRWSCVLHQVV